eukprot:3839253-Lingulodinium_polyedra.AAC.1
MVLYPAHIDLPTKPATKALETLYARAARTGNWDPGHVIGAISAVWGIRGAPRCPAAAAHAAAALTSFTG